MVKKPSANGGDARDAGCRFDPWAGKTPWRRERLPIPVFWPGEFRGLYSSWGHKELDMTEATEHSIQKRRNEESIEETLHKDTITGFSELPF